MEEKLRVIELLNQVSKLLFGNIKLAFFLLLCSLPLFCFLIFFELSLQTTVSIAYQFISQELDFTNRFDLQDEKVLSENDLMPWLIQTFLLYFFPYSLLDLLTTTMIVAASSLVYTSEEESSIVDLVGRSLKICQNRVGGCLITYLYVLLWSTSVFSGFLSDSINYLYITSLSRNFESFRSQAVILFHVAVVLIHGTIFIVLTAKFSKWSAGWNMGLVISVLEKDEDGQDIYGSDALTLSAWY